MGNRVDVPISWAAFRQAGPHGPAWLAAQLHAALYLGRLAPGDRLPSVRQLAKRLRVSPTTALDLYHRLEAEGVVDARERSGMFLRAPSGVEPVRRVACVFHTVAATARRLELQGLSPDAFASLLLSYTGRQPRSGFQFGFLGCEEALELVHLQLSRRLKFRLPIVAIPPSLPASAIATLLARNGAIRVLVTTFLSSRVAAELSRASDLPVVMLRLTADAAGFFEAPGPRFLIVRDRDCADFLRRLLCSLTVQRGAPEVCIAALAAGACRTCDRYGDRGEPSLMVAAIDELDRLAAVERETDTFYAPPTSFDLVKARYGPTHRVLPMPLEIASQTVDDLLFHYLFAGADYAARDSASRADNGDQVPVSCGALVGSGR